MQLRYIPVPFAIALLTGCSCEGGYFPVGVGHRIHICGEIVDENLRPLSGTFELATTVHRTLSTLKGRLKESKYRSTISGSKFCIDHAFVFDMVATITSANSAPASIIVDDTSVSAENFKWVVETRSRPLAKPDIRQYSLTAAPAGGTGSAFSIMGDRVDWNRKVPRKDTLSVRTSRILFSAAKLPFDTVDLQSNGKAWFGKFGQTLREVRGYSPFEPMFEYPDSWNWVGFYLEKKRETLVFKPGPIAKPLFAPATLDSPACYFGRMSDPPPLNSLEWSDSLTVAHGKNVLLDGFYLYLPWSHTWGKAVLDTAAGPESIRFAVVFEPYGKTEHFEFLRVGTEPLRPPYYARRKCFTPMEALTQNRYPCIFRKSGR